ncbi:MAG: 1-phosphofructokinase family hexose kinase [Solirubrobacterales bacterium]
MILTVTLNAAIDRNVAVPSFQRGRRHRVVEQHASAGGKGVNVARALKLLGRPVIATGLAGGPTGTRMVERLTEESILNDFLRIREETRTNTAIVDPTSGEQTEINERGPHVDADELDRFVDKLLYLAQGADVCVLAGSTPPNVPADIYATLVSRLRGFGLLTVVDTWGDPLRAVLRAGPDIVTPNVIEAEEVVGYEFNDQAETVNGLHELTRLGAREAVITNERGCLALLRGEDGPKVVRVEIDPLETVAAVGSGDALLAGYVAARYRGESSEEALAFGVACGAQSTQHFGAGALELREADRLRSSVTVTELQPASALS